MTIKKHGLSIGINRMGEEIFLSLTAVGTLTHADYEIITPMLDAALGEVKHPHVNVLFDGSELEGWDLRAAWDDLKLGLKHNNKFRKVAIYGQKKWLKRMSKLGAWFVSGEIEYFEDIESAVKWINADS